MTVGTSWSDPSTAFGGGGLDGATGDVVTESVWDKLVSDLNRLGGANGDTKTGNYGLGMAPSTSWPGSAQALQITPRTALWDSGASGSTFLTRNTYFDGTNFKAIANAPAARIVLDNGPTIAFALAASVAADANQTYTTYLTLNANGDLFPVAGTTGMTVGFIYIPAAAGAPTGAPTSLTATNAPLYYDTTNKKIMVRDQPTGTWKGVVVA